MAKPSIRQAVGLTQLAMILVIASILANLNFLPQAVSNLRLQKPKTGQPQVRSSFSPHNLDDALARQQYEFRRLQDPRLGSLPKAVRERELAFAQSLPSRGSQLNKTGMPTLAADWSRRGPMNVGGRTRALAIDLNFNGSSNRRILAGGVSGGMYLSTDEGATWNMTTTLEQFASVTCLVQDPNNRNLWYHGTGELLGSTRAGIFSIPGQGIFKSTDGGSSWAPLPATQQGKPNIFDNPFDFVWNLAIRPQDGALFAATMGAIARSTDGGASWNLVLTGQDSNGALGIFTDVAVAANGDIYATLSRNGTGLNSQQFGVFRSTNGSQFSVTSPPNLVADPYRMVLGAAASDANTLYLMVQANGSGATAADHQFFRYNAGVNSWTDLSSALPNEQGVPSNASFSSQGGYDLLVKVKPDNPEVVWIGGTNLYRSSNGGRNFTRVGGFLQSSSYAPFNEHHSDQHAMTFYPNNPNAMLSGHDGGISKAAIVMEQQQTWRALNTGYVTTQFYTIAIDPQPNNALLMGGTQDNGCWGAETEDLTRPWIPLFGGDGAYTAIVAGGNPYFVSSQNGFVFRASFNNNRWDYSRVQPATPNGERDFLFIAPFQLDPNSPRVMYMAVGNGVWRNSNLDDIPSNNQNPVSTNWMALSNSAVANSQTTTLAIASTPANRLYFGATDYQSKTTIMRVDNAGANSPGTNITPPGITGGSYPSCVAINPNNGDEIMAVFSNYQVPSLWHSSNGGGSWENVEGNLGGADGPSIRWASLVPTNSGTVYFLATSIGVYSTAALNGANTVWVQEGGGTIGNVVVDMLAARPADGVIVAATHGRGIYSAKIAGGGGSAILEVSTAALSMEAQPEGTGTAQFSLRNTGTAPLSFNITATGPDAMDAGGMLLPPATLAGGENPGTIRQPPPFELQAAANNEPPFLKAARTSTATHAVAPLMVSGSDLLINDDGDNFADDFVGFGPSSIYDFYWLNQFTPAGFGFRLESFVFYMRTESNFSNPVSLAVLNSSAQVIVQGTLFLGLAPSGGWFTITLDNPISFQDGETFSIQIGAAGTLNYPAGADVDAAVPNRSYYFDTPSNRYLNLNSISGFSQGAFVIRAVGTKTSAQNQPPIARANVSKTQARVNESISFDGSGSSDPDGQITQYLWNFGDGTTSNQMAATHAYTRTGNFTYTLTVTDNRNATAQAQGQIIVTDTNQPPVARAQVSKSQAQVNEPIGFDGSGSSDSDGQIIQYTWVFGDGATSNESITSHAYTQPGNYGYTLIVLDNQGAPGQTSGQLVITSATPSRLSVSPTSGTIPPGGNQVIAVTFNAQGLAEGDYQGALNVVSNGGNRTLPVSIRVAATSSVEGGTDRPATFRLKPNFPNPFNPETVIIYEVPVSSPVKLSIYDLRGQLIRRLLQGEQAPGFHQVSWDGRDDAGQPVASGIYLYRLEADNFHATRKLNLLR